MKEVWTIKKTIEWGTGYFAKQGIESPRLTIEYLLADLLKKKRIELYVAFERSLNPEELAQLKERIQRRAKREPLQYILGEVDFFDSVFKVSPAVLIPRPETELLVERLVQLIQKDFVEKASISILDLGTGSGAIGLSLAKAFFQAQLTAVDLSEKALAVARENAAALALTDRTRFLCGSWFEPLESDAKFDLIVSNPPYVSEKEFEQLQEEVKCFEPKEALVAGPSGLEMVEAIIPKAGSYLKERGILAFEVGLGQAEKVKTLMEEQNFKNVEVIPDLNKIDRIVIGRR